MVAETDNQPASRYERVKYILNKAHEGSSAEYQGYGRFWELSLERFLTVIIYGVQMMALGDGGAGGGGDKASGCCAKPPAPTSPRPPVVAKSKASGCCGGESGGGEGPEAGGRREPGRGAASGLIKGLRGQYPFNGTELSRIPWGGGTPVPDADIAFIESWIDDGCPEDDEQASTVEAMPDTRRALAYGDALHPLATRPINAYREEAGTLKVRKNINGMSAEELRRYRRAVACMKAYDQYGRDERSFAFWARIHANNCQHGWEELLPWHRFYLHYFEQRLQDIDPTVTVPYWDWSDSYAVNHGVATIDGGIIPEAFRCFVDDSVIAGLRGKITDATLTALAALNQPGRSFNAGPSLFAAAGIAYDASATTEAILAELSRANPLWHRFRWPGGQGVTNPSASNPQLFEDYPAPDDIQQILGLDGFFAFGSGPDGDHFFGALENIHNLLHNFTGGNNPNTLPNEPVLGDMCNAGVTAFDPIFWSHHSNVDRLWAEWQRRHPGQEPDDLTSVLAPWPGTVGESLKTTAFGSEYALSTHHFETDSDTSLVRFKSAPAEVPSQVVASHRRAEVRLKKVQHLQQGGVVRVFLNQSNADASTPTRGNDHFVGQMHLFAGDCIGGPGHCAVPPETKRAFDQRPRHRKTPHNIRFDATKTIERLKAQGDTDFQVQIVALDLQGKPSPEVLRLDAVSLMFFD